MGNWIGEMSGFCMLVLIVALFFMMLEEFRLLKDTVAAELRGIALYGFLCGLGYLSVGGLFYNASVDSSGIMEYGKVWNYGGYAVIMAGAESGSFSGGFFDEIYGRAVRLAGAIFFGQYISAAVYTSFFFAVLFAWILYRAESRLVGKENADSLLPFTFLWPFSYRLFLPSPVSLVCCILAGIAAAVLLCKKQAKVPVVKISAGWAYQVALCFTCAVNVMIYYTEIVRRGF